MRRIALAILGLSLVAVGVALVFSLALDMTIMRAFPRAFYFTGAFVAVGGFLSATTGPFFGFYGMSVDQAGKERAVAMSIPYAGLGVALIGVGFLLEVLL